MQKIKLSKNFTLDEFTRSQTATRHGIDMSVELDGVVFPNLQRLCSNILQPTRESLGSLRISSGYRPPALNKKIGGSKTSQHRTGQAADFSSSTHLPIEICVWISQNLPFEFDQLIHEFGRWVHVSVAAAGETPRNQKLTAYKKDGKTVYLPGLHSMDSIEERG